MSEVQVALIEEAAETGEKPEQAKRHRRRFEITIFDRWCKSCGLCSAFCPTRTIIADEEGRPSVIESERCTGCQWCVMHCPDLAISICALNPEATL